MGKFVITRRSNGEYQFNLNANNNEVILTSEGYRSLAACLSGIHSVKDNSTSDFAYAKLTASNGKYYFNLTAGNHQVIGTSELYETAFSMQKGIDSVKGNAPAAAVEYDEATSLAR